jgi:Holliday junction resolvase RusA-like endonuclease
MTQRVSFFVVGLPAPQGSKTAFVRGGRAVIVDGTSKTGRANHANWRRDVMQASMAQREKGVDMFTGPCEVTIGFNLPLPKTDQHRTLHSIAPDIDKLARSVLDAMVNGGLLADDSLVCGLNVTKRYAREGMRVGAGIDIFDLFDIEASCREDSKNEARQARKAMAHASKEQR